ncbi:MAG: four helix bundle protein [Clostridia bacterium]|nr:four helix bundle protein [Clostridia bacterium]
MKTDNKDKPIRIKSKAFAVRIINLVKYLRKDKHEFDLSGQIIRSGTSIGANVAESECAISGKDFLSKIYIALKECSETIYWLDLLYETEYITQIQYKSLISDCEELRKMLSSTTKTMTDSIKK